MRPSELLSTPDTNNTKNTSELYYIEDTESKALASVNNEIFNTPVLNTQYSWEEKKKN